MFTATKPTANMLPPFKTNQVQIKLKERASSRFSIYTPTITGNSLKTYGYFSNSTTTDITFNIQRMVKAKQLAIVGNMFNIQYFKNGICKQNLKVISFRQPSSFENPDFQVKKSGLLFDGLYIEQYFNGEDLVITFWTILKANIDDTGATKLKFEKSPSQILKGVSSKLRVLNSLLFTNLSAKINGSILLTSISESQTSLSGIVIYFAGEIQGLFGLRSFDLSGFLLKKKISSTHF